MSIYGRGFAAWPSPPSSRLPSRFALVFFYAPLDADQGFVQKIFYVHVPLAITALCGFVFGGVLGGMYLRTGERKWDIRSYVAIHMALIFGVGTLITGVDLGQGVLGPLVDLERPDADVVPDRDAAVRHLSAAALLDRGSRAPVPLRERVRGRGRRVRAAELHRGPRGARPTSTRAC